MSRQRFVQLLIAAVIAISVALLLNARRNQTAETAGLPVFPGLAGELNSVTAVSLQKGGATPSVTLHKSGDAWAVAERADYPADLAKLRKLLMSLGDAKIIEEKTSDPQRFAGIGVDEPASGAASVEVTVTTPKDKRSLIVGKSVGSGNFVRKPGETKTYSVEPGIRNLSLKGSARCQHRRDGGWNARDLRAAGRAARHAGRELKLRVQPGRDHRDRSAIPVVGGVDDELIVEGQLPGIDRYLVIGLKDLLGARMRQHAVADQSGQAARREVGLMLLRDHVDDTGDPDRVVRAAPEFT